MRRSPLGRQRRDLGRDPSALVEQLLRAVRAHPRLERGEVLGVLGELRQRHLVGAEGALHRLAVDLLGPRPALGRAQDDHRPARPLGGALARTRLDGGDVADHLVERLGHELVHGRRVVALDEVRLVAVADQQRAQLVVRDAREHGRVGDLVAVEVQDREHRAVARRVRRTCWSASWPPADRSRPRRRPRRSRRAGRGCRRPLRRRGPARSPARRPRGSSRASRARRGWGCRRGRRTGGTAVAGPPRRASCSGRPRRSCPRGRCWPRARDRRARAR